MSSTRRQYQPETKAPQPPPGPGASFRPRARAPGPGRAVGGPLNGPAPAAIVRRAGNRLRTAAAKQPRRRNCPCLDGQCPPVYTTDIGAPCSVPSPRRLPRSGGRQPCPEAGEGKRTKVRLGSPSTVPTKASHEAVFKNNLPPVHPCCSGGYR